MKTPTDSKPNKLKFSVHTAINVMDRDYGLMKVSQDKNRTPYPRSSTGVDPEVLRNRLSHEQQESNLADAEEPPKNRISFTKVTRYLAHTPSRGTPYPNRGKPVDPKELLKSLSSRSFVSKSVSKSKFLKRTSSNRSSMNQYLSVDTPHPNKRIVMSPTSLVRRLTEMRSVDDIEPRPKKVSFITPTASTSTTTTSQKPTSRKHQLSFAERRRQFHMAEFTIAKNGRKMCDWPLSERWHPVAINDPLAEKACEEMERFLRKQGISKSFHNVLVAPISALSRGSYTNQTGRESILNSGSPNNLHAVRSSISRRLTRGSYSTIGSPPHPEEGSSRLIALNNEESPVFGNRLSSSSQKFVHGSYTTIESQDGSGTLHKETSSTLRTRFVRESPPDIVPSKLSSLNRVKIRSTSVD